MGTQEMAGAGMEETLRVGTYNGEKVGSKYKIDFRRNDSDRPNRKQTIPREKIAW